MGLDAFTVIGLASNIVQFVDFGSRLISKGVEIYQSAEGTSMEHTELKLAIGDLQILSHNISDGLHATRHISWVSPSADEEALRQLGSSCDEVARELLKYLNKIRISTNDKHRRWKSFREALNDVWGRHQVDGLMKRLEVFRKQIDTHTLSSLRLDVNALALQHSRHFTILDETSQNTVRAFAKFQHKIDALHQRNLSTVIKEIHQARDLLFTALPQDGYQELPSQILQPNKAMAQTLRLAKKVTTNDYILESLCFESRTDRYDDIPEAHKKTFGWIHADPTPGSKPWSNFSKWLRDGAGIYWINGKAASGKSTLMKYIFDDPSTKQTLGIWARNKELLISGYFFWNSGTTMQKSQLGLLRSILHDVLKRFPQLINPVLEGSVTAADLSSGYLVQSTLWTWTSTKAAFARLLNSLNQDSVKLRILCIVDGLDEYSGDPMDLIDLFGDNALSKNLNIKVLLSSRPLLEFEEAFKSRPSLRLQDLTHDDIKAYTDDKLVSNSRMLNLMRKDPESVRKLVAEILEKASGVFLWVTLVVSSLLSGLLNSDRVPDLQKRLRELPEQLEELYDHMLHRIDGRYRAQSSRLLQIVCRKHQPLSTLAFSFASEDDPMTSATTDMPKWTPFEVEFRFQELDRRLRSRCAGLLEVHGPLDTADGLFRCRVDFIHRTAREYLERPDVWSLILKTAGLHFNVDLWLLSSCVLQVKILIPGTSEAVYKPEIRRSLPELVRESLKTASLADNSTGPEQVRLLEQLDQAASRVAPLSWASQAAYETRQMQWKDSIVSLAVEWQLRFFVKAKLDEGNSQTESKHGRPLLAYALFPHAFSSMNLRPDIRMIELLLQHGANPNEKFKGRSLWELALFHVYWNIANWNHSEPECKELCSHWAAVFSMLLHHGADPHIYCMIGAGPNQRDEDKRSLTWMIEATISESHPMKGAALIFNLNRLRATTAAPQKARFFTFLSPKKRKRVTIPNYPYEGQRPAQESSFVRF